LAAALNHKGGQEMNKQQMKDRVAELTARINEMTKERNKLNQMIAELSTELKVGDRVRIEGGRNSAEYELTAITLGYGDMPRFMGAKIRKDGTPSIRESWLWARSGDRLVKVERDAK
jgi:hypothetical protein